MNMRKVVKIDEELCDGCGQCVPACAEGAIRIVDGKVRLLAENLCDGLGACLGECPRGAISIEERPAEAFDHEAVRRARESPPIRIEARPFSGCPSAQVQVRAPVPLAESGTRDVGASALSHWPVKLRLVPPTAPFLNGADLVLTADCVPVAKAAFNPGLLSEKAVLIGCPKFDDLDSARDRLAGILVGGNVRSVTVAVMEVPCCSGFRRIAREAIAASGRDIPLRELIVSRDGRVEDLPAAGLSQK